MKSKFSSLLLWVCLLLGGPVFAQSGTDMIHTYWHDLGGPTWIYKPLDISFAQGYVYTFGSDKNGNYSIFRSSDLGSSWDEYPRNDEPPNSISACWATGQDAYYTSPGQDVFSTANAGANWGGSNNDPPENPNLTVCAVSQYNPLKAFAGCQANEGDPILNYTVNHGESWTEVGGYTNYSVTDAAFHPYVEGHQEFEGRLYVALDGGVANNFLLSTDGGINYVNRSISAVDRINCLAVYYESSTMIAAAGSDDTDWKLLVSYNDGQNWSVLNLPAGFSTDIQDGNQIRDLAVNTIASGPAILVATDVGIFQYDLMATPPAWVQIYDHAADANVYSIAVCDAEDYIFAGTLHSFIRGYPENNWKRVPEVGFAADLAGASTLTSLTNDIVYTLNARTGAIFRLDLKFDDFDRIQPIIKLANPANEMPLIGNISGEDGEFDGQALAAAHFFAGENEYDVIIASSKSEYGDMKYVKGVVDYTASTTVWTPFTIDNDPVIEKFYFYGHDVYGIDNTNGGIIYHSSDDGDNWETMPDPDMDRVNQVFVFRGDLYAAGYGNSKLMKFIQYSYWDRFQDGLDAVSEVFDLNTDNPPEQTEPALYAATDLGVFKLESVPGTLWVLSAYTAQFIPEPAKILLPGADFSIYPLSDDRYRNFVIYGVFDGEDCDRFFISADTARTWIEDSDFGVVTDLRFQNLMSYDSHEGGPAAHQWGVVAATNHGLFYYPHNIINGTYSATETEDMDFRWGPGLIVVNGDVKILPKHDVDPLVRNFHKATLQVTPNCQVKFVPRFVEGNSGAALIEVKSELIRLGSGPENEITTTFDSYQPLVSAPYYWAGFQCLPYVEYNRTYYPTLSLRYSLIDSAKTPIYSENAEVLGISHSEILHGPGSGVTVLNGQPAALAGFQRFSVSISNSTIRNHPTADIYIGTTAGETDCEPWPWDPKGEDYWNPNEFWPEPDPKNPDGGYPEFDCDYKYYTDVIIANCTIDSSQNGVILTGFMVAFVFENEVNSIEDYGLQASNFANAWISSNDIHNNVGSISESGVYLYWPVLALLEENEIQNCDKSAIEVVGRSWTSCQSNYLHNNDLSNIYIESASPWIAPENPNTVFPPNTLFGAEIGCYVIRSNFTYGTTPIILHNRIKGYSGHGVYVLNTAYPIMGFDYGGDPPLQMNGYNSITSTVASARNMTWSEVLPIHDIQAKGNWWGSNDPQNFRISNHIVYSPWLSTDPYPGTTPKREGEPGSLPETFSINRAYPNPFNSNVNIEFSAPNRGDIQVAIFDILGRQVKSYPSSLVEAGKHLITWDGKANSGETAVSGIYFVRLVQGDQVALKKITLLK